MYDGKRLQEMTETELLNAFKDNAGPLSTHSEQLSAAIAMRNTRMLSEAITKAATTGWWLAVAVAAATVVGALAAVYQAWKG